MILDDIVANKREELTFQKQQVSLGQLQDMPLFHSQPPGLFQALSTWNGRAIIAEVKKASPSKGVIRQDFNPLALARSYEASGAAAISVLTEKKFFQGSLDYLKQIRQQVALPLLRKDFVFDDYQVYEARAHGASAILLIVAILEDDQLQDLMHLAQTLKIDCLIEVHDEVECERALAHGVSLLGINNRDLRTFHTTIETSERLVQGLPSDVLVVSESGLSARHQLDQLEAQGVRAFLIGETFMAAPDPGAPLRSLLGHPT
ncbi:MAG: indole-3-glycerol phosphate synthase TrpC [Desulfurellaceae bacterium]|nr:indole-3-glycerol phosphate synthase TrpC [Desulfurellaceae bacterium]